MTASGLKSGELPRHGASGPERVLILGGGVGGLEALMALKDLAGELLDVTLVAPQREFVFKPMVVEEPFSLKPAERRDLSALVEEFGSSFVLGAVAQVRPEGRTVELIDGTTLDYDHLIVAVGARSSAAFENAETFISGGDLRIDELLDRAARHPSKSIALVVPMGTSWPLPLYELALMARTRAIERGHLGLAFHLYSPESEPLSVFGAPASAEVARILAARKITFHGDSNVTEDETGALRMLASRDEIEAEAVLALPAILGPAVPGLPADANGFTMIDPRCRVRGLERVYAVGDGANFPIKQGGLAAQQADVAAEEIAAAAGAKIEVGTFHPILRGQLLASDESFNLSHDLTGKQSEGQFSSDYLWWPPGKVSGRYLTPWLTGIAATPEPESRPINVEVAIGADWHKTPVAMGSHPNPL